MWTINSLLKIGDRSYSLMDLIDQKPVLYGAVPLEIIRQPFADKPTVVYRTKAGDSLGQLDGVAIDAYGKNPGRDLFLQFRDNQRRPYYVKVTHGQLSQRPLIEQGVKGVPTVQERAADATKPKDFGDATYTLLTRLMFYGLLLGGGYLYVQSRNNSNRKR